MSFLSFLFNYFVIFEKKKIQIETLSEYLTEVRKNLHFSLKEVCDKTGISQKFLTALEEGNFKYLPADVYVYGFLRQLSLFYAISGQALIDQYKKERGILQQLAKDGKQFKRGRLKQYWQKLVITPKIFSLAVGLAFVALTVGYIIWQVWSINRMPSLVVDKPVNNAVVVGAFVQVLGQTDPGITVLVNGQAIFVDSTGHFTSQLALVAGPEEIVVTAKNRFGKSVSKTIDIIGAAAALGNNAALLQLKLDFTASGTLTAVVDSQSPQTLNFSPGDSKTFSAQSQIILSTSDAGATKVTVNGQALGVMGRSKEALTNISFFAQPASAGK